jgi:NAD+ diphosphatase
MLAFTALGDPEQPLRLDRDELEDARWFTRRDVRTMWASRSPIRSSVAYYLMSRWLDS